MKILFVTMEYPPDTGIGGIGSNIAGMVPSLVARGHEVHVLSCYPDQERRDVDHEGATVHRRPRRRSRLLRRLVPREPLVSRLEAIWSVWREFRALRLAPDVVNVPDWFAEGLALTLLTRVPVVAYLHTPLHLIVEHNQTPIGRLGLLGDRLERAEVRRCTVVTSTSQHLVDDLTGSGWLPSTLPVRITPPPVQVHLFESVPPVERSEPLLLAIGRIEARKAPEVLVDAAALLRERGHAVEVALLGRSSGRRDGLDYVDWLRRRASEAGVPLHAPGHVGREELPAWLARSRVLVVPSRYESFSITALEGAAAGRPVVVTEQVGAREVVAGPGGRIVPVGDPDALAAALSDWVADAGRAARDGSRVRDQVLEACAPERAARLREEAFLDALARTPVPWRRRLLGR